MTGKYLKFYSLVTLFCVTGMVKGQNDCSIKNTAFKAGEKVTYIINYHWHFIWLESAQVTFTVSLKNYYNVPCYYFEGSGGTYPKYDWFYKVRDTFRAYCDTTTISSRRFFRITNEGPAHISNDNVFNYARHKVYCLSADKAGKYHEDSVHIASCTYDVLTAIYYTRCFNFSGYSNGDTIPVTLYLDAHIYHIHLTYLGKEVISSSLGKFRCIKFNVSLISGTIFKAGQQMTVWITDDKNRLPIRVDAPVIIGAVRAELKSFSNLRNPVDAKVN